MEKPIRLAKVWQSFANGCYYDAVTQKLHWKACQLEKKNNHNTAICITEFDKTLKFVVCRCIGTHKSNVLMNSSINTKKKIQKIKDKTQLEILQVCCLK